MNNYDTAVGVVSSELKTNAKFKAFYDEVRENPECRRNDLKSFLILPVQRIPRYELLLRELIRKTPEDHADYAPLNEAFNKIKAISTLIDNRKDESVKLQEVMRIHAMLEPKVPNLIAPTRRLVAETEFLLLPRLGANKAKAARVLCFLFNDFFILAESAHEEGRRSSTTMRSSSMSSSGGLLSPPSKESSSSPLSPGRMYRPLSWATLLEMSVTVSKDCMLIRHADVEHVLTGTDDGDAVVKFVKTYSRARVAQESVASTMRGHRRGNSSEGARLGQSGGANSGVNSASNSPAIQKKALSDPSRHSKGVAPMSAASVGLDSSSGSISLKTEENLEKMAEEAKSGALEVLQEMLKEAELALAKATDENEVKSLTAKVAGLKTTLTSQQQRNALGRRGSTVDIAMSPMSSSAPGSPAPERKSTSGWGRTNTPSPSASRLSLFASARRSRSGTKEELEQPSPTIVINNNTPITK